jgi:hypothetical protein
MPLRVTVSAREDLTVIRVDGRLAGDGVAELERASRSARRPLVLDLAHLATADDAGVLALRRLAREGVHLVGTSPYMGLLLGEGPGEGTPVLPPRRRKPGSLRRSPGDGKP